MLFFQQWWRAWLDRGSKERVQTPRRTARQQTVAQKIAKKVSFMSEALKNMNVLRKSRKVTYLQYLNFEHLFIKICFKLQDSIAVFSPPHPA